MNPSNDMVLKARHALSPLVHMPCFSFSFALALSRKASHRFYILHFMLRLAQEQYGPLFVGPACAVAPGGSLSVDTHRAETKLDFAAHVPDPPPEQQGSWNLKKEEIASVSSR